MSQRLPDRPRPPPNSLYSWTLNSRQAVPLVVLPVGVTGWPTADPRWWSVSWTPSAGPLLIPEGEPPVDEDSLPGRAELFPVADPRFGDPRWAQSWAVVAELALRKPPSGMTEWRLPARLPWRDTFWAQSAGLALAAKPPQTVQLVVPPKAALLPTSWLRGPQPAAEAVLPPRSALEWTIASPPKAVASWIARPQLVAEEVEEAEFLPGAATAFSLAELPRSGESWLIRSAMLVEAEPPAETHLPGRGTGFPVADPARRATQLSWTGAMVLPSLVLRAPFRATQLTLQYDRRIHGFAFVGGAIYLPEGEVEPETTYLPGAVTAFGTADPARRGEASWTSQKPPEAAVAAALPPRGFVTELPRRAARGDVSSFMAPVGAIRIPAVMPPKSDQGQRNTRPAARALQQGWQSSIGPMLVGSLVKPPPTMQNMTIPGRRPPLLPQFVAGPFPGWIPGEVPPQPGGDIHTTFFGTIRVGTLGVR